MVKKRKKWKGVWENKKWRVNGEETKKGRKRLLGRKVLMISIALSCKKGWNYKLTPRSACSWSSWPIKFGIAVRLYRKPRHKGTLRTSHLVLVLGWPGWLIPHPVTGANHDAKTIAIHVRKRMFTALIYNTPARPICINPEIPTD